MERKSLALRCITFVVVWTVASSYAIYSGNPKRSNVSVATRSSKWDRDIDEKSRDEAAGQINPRETIAGAMLGSLLLGPFGAIWGASIGAGVGQRIAADEARKREMERLGLSPELLNAAREVGEALERNMEGIKAGQESYETQKRFAIRLESEAEEIYAKAKEALESSDEDRARKLLLERDSVQEKLKEVLKTCATARRQVVLMEENASILEKKATEIDSLLKRTVGAKALQDSSSMGLSLSSSDPLLDKFRDMGID